MEGDTDKPMNRSQEVLHTLCLGPDAVVSPKLLAHRLHRAHDYISDICRRDRVDFLAVFNELLKAVAPLARTNTCAFAAIGNRVSSLLLEGTAWELHYVESIEQTTFTKLCEHAGILLQDLGACLSRLAVIEADGRVDEADDVAIGEFSVKADQLAARLRAIQTELHRRRQESTV